MPTQNKVTNNNLFKQAKFSPLEEKRSAAEQGECKQECAVCRKFADLYADMIGLD